MNQLSSPSYHTVGHEWMAAYVGGTLSNTQRLVLECQADINPALATELARLDEFGGALLETAQGEPVSTDFFTRISVQLDQARAGEPQQRALESAANNPTDRPDWMPDKLHAFLTRTGQRLNWRDIGLGVKRAYLTQRDPKERLYLLWSRAGTTMPVHSHTGEEWTLVLQGGYHTGDTGYVRGDLHQEDETCEHQPIVDDDGEDCISLVADQGRMKFRNPALMLYQQFFQL